MPSEPQPALEEVDIEGAAASFEFHGRAQAADKAPFWASGHAARAVLRSAEVSRPNPQCARTGQGPDEKLVTEAS